MPMPYNKSMKPTNSVLFIIEDDELIEMANLLRHYIDKICRLAIAMRHYRICRRAMGRLRASVNACMPSGRGNYHGISISITASCHVKANMLPGS